MRIFAVEFFANRLTEANFSTLIVAASTKNFESKESKIVGGMHFGRCNYFVIQ